LFQFIALQYAAAASGSSQDFAEFDERLKLTSLHGEFDGHDRMLNVRLSPLAHAGLKSKRRRHLPGNPLN
jgi:hypothetical protein